MSRRWWLLMVAVATASCERAGPPGPYQCAARDTLTIWESTVNDETPGSFVVASDSSGYVLIWTRDLSLDFVSIAGVFAARPGGAIHQIVRGQDAASVVVAAVSDGLLACYWGQGECGTQSMCLSCLTVGPALDAVHGPEVVGAGIPLGLLRVGGKLHRLTEPDASGPVLTTIDERGREVEDPVALPCQADFGRSLFPVAWNDSRLACLVPSDPSCGTQSEPLDCTYSLRIFDELGAVVAEVPEPAPFVRGSSGGASLAGNGDRFLIAWRELPSGLGARAVSNDGTPGDETVVQIADRFPAGPWLTATPIGYAMTWVENLSNILRAPRLAVLGQDGAVSAGPLWLSIPTDEDPDQTTPVAGSVGGGLGVAWTGMYLDESFHAWLLFRDLGCDLSTF